MPNPSIALYLPSSTGRKTGGYRYNDELAAGLNQAGFKLAQAASPEIEVPASIHIVDSLWVQQYVKASLPAQQVIFLYHLPPTPAISADDLKGKHLVVTGNGAKQLLASQYPGVPLSLHKITPGIDANWLKKDKYAKVASKLLVVSSVVPGKGFELLLELLSGLGDLHWHCTIIGELDQDRAYAQAVQRKFEQANLGSKVTFLGSIDHQGVNQAMCEADLLLHCSSFETYCMAIAEALAAHLPVLAVTTGELEEFVSSPHFSYFAQPDSASQKAQLRQLVTEPASYKGLVPKAGTKVKPWSEMVSQWRRLLLSLAGKPGQLLEGNNEGVGV